MGSRHLDHVGIVQSRLKNLALDTCIYDKRILEYIRYDCILRLYMLRYTLYNYIYIYDILCFGNPEVRGCSQEILMHLAKLMQPEAQGSQNSLTLGSIHGESS